MRHRTGNLAASPVMIASPVRSTGSKSMSPAKLSGRVPFTRLRSTGLDRRSATTVPGTVVALRLSNPVDRSRVKGTLPDNLAGLMDLLPVLRTGEAIITGEAARLPVRCRIILPSAEHLPRSSDPQVTQAWATRRAAEGYDRVVASWRSQSTTAVVNEIDIQRSPVTDGEL